MIYYLHPFGKQFRRITPMKKITGNMVSSNEYFFGELTIENNIITRVRKISAPETDADITLPGFIDTHLHGLGEYSAESPEGIRGMAAFAPVCGTTAIVPTFASEPEKFYTEMLAAVRDMVRTPPPGARIPGCHMAELMVVDNLAAPDVVASVAAYSVGHEVDMPSVGRDGGVRHGLRTVADYRHWLRHGCLSKNTKDF